MKWMLNKLGGRKRRWCGMLKGENESVENGEDVETIVHSLSGIKILCRTSKDMG